MSETEGRLERHALSEEAARDVRTVAKGGAVQIAGQVSERGLGMLFGAIAVRLLGLGGFGLYRQVVQVLAISGQLGLAGFNYSAMRFIARARARADHGGVRGTARASLAATTFASVAVFAALMIGADRLAAPFDPDPEGQAELAALLRIGAAYVPLFAYMQVLRYCTQAYKTMVPSVVVGNIIQPAVRFVLGVGFLIAGFAVTGAVTSLVIGAGVGAGAGAWYFHRILTQDERAAVPKASVGQMTRFALPQAGASLLGIQSLGLGIILLGMLSSDADVGAFAVALALQVPGGLFLSGIVNIWAPVVSDLYEKDQIARLGSLYQTITRWVATFSFPIYAALIIQPELFARIYGGREAAVAAPVVAILALGNLFYSGTGPTGYVISMTGRPGVNFANSVVAVVAYVIGGVIFVPTYGVVGMAVVDAVVTALVNSARVIQAKLLVGIQPFGRSFLKPVVATIVGAGILLAWRLVPGDGYPLDIAGLVVAGLAYVAVLKAFGVDAEERYVWDQIRSRALKKRRSRT